MCKIYNFLSIMTAQNKQKSSSKYVYKYQSSLVANKDRENDIQYSDDGNADIFGENIDYSSMPSLINIVNEKHVNDVQKHAKMYAPFSFDSFDGFNDDGASLKPMVLKFGKGEKKKLQKLRKFKKKKQKRSHLKRVVYSSDSDSDIKCLIFEIWPEFRKYPLSKGSIFIEININALSMQDFCACVERKCSHELNIGTEHVQSAVKLHKNKGKRATIINNLVWKHIQWDFDSFGFFISKSSASFSYFSTVFFTLSLAFSVLLYK